VGGTKRRCAQRLIVSQNLPLPYSLKTQRRKRRCAAANGR
jgi:hypothetical protein